MAEEFAKSLERYDVVDRIAVGGMAEVFLAKAYGAHGFEKTLAIKRILPDLARDPEFEQRFIAEAKVAVKLSHTNIVQVMDFGRFAESLFIAMEYVDGLDLAALLRRYKEMGAKVPVPAAFQIAIEIARGLDYAHQHGVVHRDVSPSNILLSRAGEVKIADFGIAVAATARRGIAPGTGPRKVMGKWRYMSPEQARGENLDTRSDLFSAASVMFELFTGEKLFPGDEPEDIIKNIHEMTLPRASKVRDGLPNRLDEILGQALARRPLDRPARAAVMLRALTELSYESSVVCTSIDVSDAVGFVLPKDQTAQSVVDEMIRKQLAGETGVARETAVTDGKKRETLVTNAKHAGVDTTGVFRHKIDLDGVSRLEVADPLPGEGDSTTLAAQPRARRQTGQPIATEPADADGKGPTLTGLAAAVAELGVQVPFDPDRRTEVGPPLAESRPFFKVEPDERDKTAAREKIDASVAKAPAKAPPAKAPPPRPSAPVIEPPRLPTERPEGTPTGTGPTTSTSRRGIWIGLAALVVAAAGIGGYIATRPPPVSVPIVQNPIDARPAPTPTGSVDLTSDPSGAEITIDDQPQGTTPKKLELAAGDHTIAMTLPGRRPFEKRINLAAGATEPIAAALEPLLARLKVKSTPKDATVKVDGTDYGKTPLDRDGLPPGTVTLEVIKAGYEPVKEKIELVADKVTEKSYPLVESQRFGYVLISLAELGVAKVYDEHNKLIGQATRGGGAGKIQLPVGHHKLKLVGKQGSTTIDVDIKENQTVNKPSVVLKK